MRYRLEIKKKAQKRIQRLPPSIQQAIVKVIDGLATEPRPVGCRKLCGQESYSIRSGNYRILYTIQDTIQDDILVVVVIDAGHRRDVYRNL